MAVAMINEYEHWRQRAAREPTHAVSHFNWGWWAARNGRYEEAAAAYQRALTLNIAEPEEAMTNLSNRVIEAKSGYLSATSILIEAIFFINVRLTEMIGAFVEMSSSCGLNISKYSDPETFQVQREGVPMPGCSLNDHHGDCLDSCAI